jgi:hypothetical protein
MSAIVTTGVDEGNISDYSVIQARVPRSASFCGASHALEETTFLPLENHENIAKTPRGLAMFTPMAPVLFSQA